jgi:hypothetical protein
MFSAFPPKTFCPATLQFTVSHWPIFNSVSVPPFPVPAR